MGQSWPLKKFSCKNQLKTTVEVWGSLRVVVIRLDGVGGVAGVRLCLPTKSPLPLSVQNDDGRTFWRRRLGPH